MYCKKCGKEIDFDSTFCSYCGIKQVLNQSLENRFVADTKPNPGSRIIDIAKSFEIQKDNAKDEVVKIDKVYRSYKGDINASITGIVVLILSSILLTISRQSTDPFFIAFYWISLLLWWIIAIPWVVKIAKRQNRRTMAWGIFAFFLPYIAIIIIGLLKKLNTPIKESSISESNQLPENELIPNEKIIDNLKVESHEQNSNKAAEGISGNVSDNVTYKVIETGYIKQIWGKEREEIKIKFSDGKIGLLLFSYSVEKYYFKRGVWPNYYNNKEATIIALHYYLCYHKVLEKDRYYYI